MSPPGEKHSSIHWDHSLFYFVILFYFYFALLHHLCFTISIRIAVLRGRRSTCAAWRQDGAFHPCNGHFLGRTPIASVSLKKKEKKGSKGCKGLAKAPIFHAGHVWKKTPRGSTGAGGGFVTKCGPSAPPVGPHCLSFISHSALHLTPFDLRLPFLRTYLLDVCYFSKTVTICTLWYDMYVHMRHMLTLHIYSLYLLEHTHPPRWLWWWSRRSR